MDSNKPNKISDIVKLRRLLKKWKKATGVAGDHLHQDINSYDVTNVAPRGGNSINKFLKKTLSFSDLTMSSSVGNNGDDFDVVPKGCLAVCVGKEMSSVKRYVIPTEYLSHHEFQLLLREAEEEFGFQQDGVLKIPCELQFFDDILKIVQDERNHDTRF